MRPHLDLLSALDRIAQGHIVPSDKYSALQRRGLIRVVGHGAKSKVFLTEAGRKARADEVGR